MKARFLRRRVRAAAARRSSRGRPDTQHFFRRLTLERLEGRQMLTAYLVTSLADTLAADGAITLREAVQAANTNQVVNEAPAGSSTQTDSIQFDPSLTGGTITLGGTQLTISQGLDIHGLGPDRLTISANNASRIFNITGASTAVTVDGMRLTSGNASNGGGINTAGRLTLSEAIIENCQSISYAAAIYNTGQLSLRSVTLRSNTTTGSSGGTVYDGSGSSLLVINSTVSGNLGAMGLGIMHQGAALTVINSTISGNTTTSNGGGLWVYSGTATIVQSTITGNSAAQGGGVYVQSGATAVVKNMVIAGNTSTGHEKGTSLILVSRINDIYDQKFYTPQNQ
jgi:CSLREA domain-containing protein